MNAYPLKNGRRIVAWACGVCHHPAAGWTHSVGWDESDVEQSREQAAKCCQCSACARQRAADSWSYCDNADCVAARQKAEASRAAEAQAAEETDCDSWERAVSLHDFAWRFRLYNGRVGMLYVGDAWSGMRSSAFARLDPTPEEPDPPVHSSELQSSAEGSPWQALASLCYRYNEHVAYVAPVPRVDNVVEGDEYEDGEGVRWHVVGAPSDTSMVDLRNGLGELWNLTRDAFRGKLRPVALMPRGGRGQPWATAPGDPSAVPVTEHEGAAAHAIRAEAEVRAQVAAALRGEDVALPYLSDEVRAARALVADRDDLRELVKGLDKANADLRGQVLELQRRAPVAASCNGPST